MPDLDQIKQEEQERGTGAGGFPRAGRAIPPAGPRGSTSCCCVHKSNIRSAAVSHKFVAATSGLKANPTIVHGQNGPMAESARCLMPQRPQQIPIRLPPSLQTSLRATAKQSRAAERSMGRDCFVAQGASRNDSANLIGICSSPRWLGRRRL